ncbi:MAG TPA: hypothetical protein VOB72_03615 [Candidatus Dormibacteraeota bacterium]|nr:hypothetical protein [Candidatus Dormibacteraeota bacterium]
MSESSAVRIDLLQSHVRAILDEVRRAGPEACRAALDDAEAKLPERLRDPYTARADSVASVAQSCAGLYTLAAVAMQLAQDFSDTDASIPYILDAAEHTIAAQAQGCNSHG